MRRFTLTIATLLIAAPAFAQSTADMQDRLNRLERDLNFVQKQVYTGSGSSGGGAPVSGNAAVQFQQLSEEIRQLRGQIEQIQYQSNKNAQDLQKFMGDMDYRVQALEQRPIAAATPEPAPVAEEPAAEEENEPATYQRENSIIKVKDAPKESTKAPTGRDFPNSNAHYSYAFKQLNEKNYAASAASFDQFVKKYPSDPLTGNAYYWLGESYYARGDYTRAAEGFRKGFEANPEGQKAPDNLLKLAMSLEKVKRVNEACIVLKQVKTKYASSASSTAAKASTQMTALQCK